MSPRPLELVLLWHMHQPDYRDRARGQFLLPWVYLHAMKDYSDMAAHLERHPGVHAVVNFVPILLEQLDDYTRQFDSGELRDPLLGALAAPDLGALDAEGRRFLLESCFRTNHANMVAPFPKYRRLLELYRLVEGQDGVAPEYLSGAYFSDLVTWYHLVWMGETERRRRPLLAELMAKGEAFTPAERLALLELIGEVLKGIVPRYRALAHSGQIELSTTPWGHPLAPLLLDFASARESEPAAALPSSPRYPGGRSRFEWHLARALAAHERFFGAPPEGVWPAEGAVSEEVLAILAHHGVKWTASSERVLAASRRKSGERELPRAETLYRCYSAAAAPGLRILFRDDALSDAIGFEYSKWHGRDAAAHFVAQLEAIAAHAPQGETPLVAVMLDGENAWEYYPYNAYYFFEDLYSALESHPAIRTTTPSAYLREHPTARGELRRIAAGSWVHGSFSTWVGEADKNRAWDLLCAAKQSYDLVMASGRLDARQRELAEAQLAVCESSDWFWWFGPHNPARTVAAFDRLYRLNLANLYALLGLAAPQQLAQPLGRGAGAPELGGTMRRAPPA